ncbi:MAG: hypothetical protein WDO19_11510 [Bacteroidota bacterium]
MANNSNKENLDPQKKEEVLCAALKKFGFLFPENEKEVQQFEEVFGNTEIDLPPDLSDGQFLLKALAGEEPAETVPTKSLKENKVISVKSSPSNVDYYRRTLLQQKLYMSCIRK